MQDPLSRYQALRRPRLLLQAACSGLGHYSRKAHLPQVVGHIPNPRLRPCLPMLEELLDMEAKLNEARRLKVAGYSYTRHVAVLIATLAEAQGLREATSDAPLGTPPKKQAPKSIGACLSLACEKA
ncbi:DUF6477 family protein [uncultured Lentibacter sp.]|jgi:hypothetical protein|uniref:DUF6477 family protein n=1 Tax=uncultured Lentibacter sp. TaxID=1659309 RepID=UPI00262224CC|nr:DUF6477 family protein [uncultured Lentibacter sp.]